MRSLVCGAIFVTGPVLARTVLERGPPVSERVAPDVLIPHTQEVERHERGRPVMGTTSSFGGRGKPELNLGEVESIVDPDDKLPIEDQSGWELIARDSGDVGERDGDVLPASGLDPAPSVMDEQQRSIAVELRLVDTPTREGIGFREPSSRARQDEILWKRKHVHPQGIGPVGVSCEIIAPRRVRRESSPGEGSQLLVAAENGGDRAPRNTRFAGSRHSRRYALVDEIPGRISSAGKLVEVGQRQSVEDAGIVGAESHGQIMAPT